MLCADIAHISGLVAGGVHPSPIPHCDAVTTTTHKTLRGPRGGLILSKAEHAKAIDKAVFPGLQGGPHNHSTAAKAVAFKEALDPSFKAYAQQIIDNARALGEALVERGHTLITGGTDNHLLLVDVNAKGIGGRKAARALNTCGLVLNANSIPFDPRKPFDPSGVRMGLAALTSRGMTTDHMSFVADIFDEGVKAAIAGDGEVAEDVAAGLRQRVKDFVADFPAPGL